MQDHKILAPALRRRLAELPEGESISLRALAAEFGQYVAPEVAYRRWRGTGGSSPGMLGLVELNREQQVALGRVRYVADTLQRIGAKYTGSRTSPDRMFHLPPEAREVRTMAPTFLTLPSPADAVAHLTARIRMVQMNKSRPWTIDDQRATTSLMRLAERAITAGLVDDLLTDHPIEPAPATIIPATSIPAGPPPGEINPRQPSYVERMFRRES